MHRRLIPSAAALAVLALAGPASAASWKPVTSGTNGNTERVGLTRTADGTLHIVYTQERSSSASDLLHRTISAGGVLGAPSAVAASWASVSNPAIVSAPGGALRAFFGGLHSTNSSDPNLNLNTAISTDGGAHWTVAIGTVAADNYAYASDMTATVVGPALTPYVSWAATPGVLVHAGLSPLLGDGNFQTQLGGCCGYDSNIVTDNAGRLLVAWYSNATGHSGVYVQQASAAGQPVGGAVSMPGVAQGGQTSQQVGRVGLAARDGGGVYAAYHGGYPSAGKVLVWRVGSAHSTQVGTAKASTGNANVNDAASADGRIWAFWRDDNRVFARRSNTSVTKWGPVIDAGVPGHTVDVFEVNGSAIGGGLDLFADATIGTTPKTLTYWQRLLPALSVKVKSAKAVKGKKVKVTVTVTDAGDPVAGAKVKLGGRSATTGATGKVRLKLGPFSATKRLTAKVTDPLYRSASAKLKIKVRKH